MKKPHRFAFAVGILGSCLAANACKKRQVEVANILQIAPEYEHPELLRLNLASSSDVDVARLRDFLSDQNIETYALRSEVDLDVLVNATQREALGESFPNLVEMFQKQPETVGANCPSEGRATQLDPDHEPDEKFLSYGEMKDALSRLAEKHPTMAKLHTITKSSDGNYDVLALQMGANVNNPTGVYPSVLIVGSFSGYDLAANEAAYDLVEQFLNRDAADQRLSFWLQHTNIWVVPMPNPGGVELAGMGRPLQVGAVRASTGEEIALRTSLPPLDHTCKSTVEGHDNQIQSRQNQIPSAVSSEAEALIGLAKELRPALEISFSGAGRFVGVAKDCSRKFYTDSTFLDSLASEVARDLGSVCSDQAAPVFDRTAALPTQGNWDAFLAQEYATLALRIGVADWQIGAQPDYQVLKQNVLPGVRKAWNTAFEKLWQNALHGVVTHAPANVTGKLMVTQKLASGVVPFAAQQFIQKEGFTLFLPQGNYDVSLDLEGVAPMFLPSVEVRNCNFPQICAPRVKATLPQQANDNALEAESQQLAKLVVEYPRVIDRNSADSSKQQEAYVARGTWVENTGCSLGIAVVKEEGGVRITQVSDKDPTGMKESAAARGRLKSGSVIRRANDRPVRSEESLLMAIAGCDRTSLVIDDDAVVTIIPDTIGEQQEPAPQTPDASGRE